MVFLRFSRLYARLNTLLPFLGFMGLVVILTSCSSLRSSGPSGGVTPKDEPLSASGNPKTYTVFGKTYKVRNSSKGYSEVGLASWYGKDFHGKLTSSGTPYNMHAYSAAHKSLPIPTYVRVENLENGKSLILRVDDRGPFVANRIIDLSYRAAQELEVVQKGTAKVRVTALSPYQSLANKGGKKSVTIAATPPKTPSPPKTKPQKTQPPPPQLYSVAQNNTQGISAYYYLQIGAFNDRENALRYRDGMRNQGFNQAEVIFNQGLFRVIVGKYTNYYEAKNSSNHLSIPNTIVKS